MEIWYPTGSIIISVCLDLLGSTRRRYYSGKRGQDFCKDTKKQQNSGGGRGASWVKSVGSCRLHHSKGTCISTQYPNCQLHHTQRRAVRLAVGHSLCVSAPNTLPSQPSSGSDQMCKTCRWAVFCTDQMKASKAVQQGFTWENHHSLFQFGHSVRASQSEHHLSNESDAALISFPGWRLLCCNFPIPRWHSLAFLTT